MRSTRIRMRADGDMIGPFRRLRSLGAGSHGEVFLAERVEPFEQRVAIKMLAADAAVDEAGMLTALDHPHIVKLLDRGVAAGGGRYIVMEYVDGEPVDAYCDRHALTQAARLSMVVRIMDALAHAHRHLVVHADLKPSNILVTSAGEPKVLDFGVAQLLAKPGATRAVDGIGGHTPAFASPEQMNGVPLTAASDVYSLGMLARHLLRSTTVGADLDAILAAATQPEPDARYPSMEMFEADMRRLLRGDAVSVRPISRAARLRRTVLRHKFMAAAALCISAILIASAYLVVRSAAVAERERRLAQTQLRKLVALTGTLQGELYDSAGQLAQSTAARQVLLQGASQTLAKLAALRNDDAAFDVELASQYARLAGLESAQGARAEAVANFERGRDLLQRVGRSSREFARAQAALAELAVQRAAAEARTQE